jgi:hypothetical protein
MRRALLGVVLGAVAAAALPQAVRAQAGPGTATAAVLQIPGGSRAAGLGGAYTAGTDGDGLFYNPASAAWHAVSAGWSHQRHVMDIGYSSVGAAVRVWRLGIGASFAVLDYGSIEELVPDPAFAGQRGIETGEWRDANDAVARVTLAVPLFRQRLALGASVGLLWSTLAESVRTVELFDVGAQYRLGEGLSIGAALRNGGGQLEGAGLEPADLPAEVRAGIAWTLPAHRVRGLRAVAHTDFIAPLYDASNAIAAGLEIGTAPASAIAGFAGQRIGVAGRVGFNGGPGARALGRMHYGAGLSVDGVALDYTLQPMGELGLAHRIGLRWTPAH